MKTTWNQNTLVELMREYQSYEVALARHSVSEGYERTDVDSFAAYDRVLHPWLHGRRLHDIHSMLSRIVTNAGQSARSLWANIFIKMRLLLYYVLNE